MARGTIGIRRIGITAAAMIFLSGVPALADEGGISFWLPGIFGSLAATPTEPGWSAATVYIHPSVSAGGGAEFQQGGEIRAGLKGRGDLFAFGPTYTFEEPALGGQAAVSLLGIIGRNTGSVEATLTGPNGGEVSGKASDTLTSYGDLLPQATLKWNHGVNNYMFYVTGDIPIGDYEAGRLANLGIGHAAIDGGIGYTYFNPGSGNEFSIVGGLTYNFENEHTDYQNGIDSHIDWGASHFFTPQFHAGAVGYYYQQLTADSGSGAELGSFKSRVAGIGPQAGYLFPAGDLQGYVNVKGYWEFAAENRPEGWNVWVTLAFSPRAEHRN